MFIALGIILIITLTFPFLFKKIETNLEFFLFIMGLSSVIASSVFNIELFQDIFTNKFLYMITAAVLIAGLAFMYFKETFKKMVNKTLGRMSLQLYVFLVIVILGLLSSVITAIVASLILVEIISLLPIDRKKKIQVTIVACFSIGVGAALTPIGEPLSTVVVSRLDVGFFYMIQQLAIYIIPCVFLLGLIGVWFVNGKSIKKPTVTLDSSLSEVSNDENAEDETLKGVLLRTFKIFVFIIALEMLGTGFKPIIDAYVVNISSEILYWGNMISAVLDNATLAAAEISPSMSTLQIKAILMGLLISGGMLIPGNIPNIVSAGKLKIDSKEWARTGVPLGLVLLTIYFVLLFII